MLFRHQAAFFIFIFAFIGSSCSQSSTVLDRKGLSYFESQLKAVITGYVRIKNGLVNNNVEIAAREARELRAFMEVIQMNRLDANVAKYWIDNEKAMRQQLAIIGTTESLKEQRLKFHAFSTHLINMVETFGPLGLSLYKQYCPKALGGEGASWINEVKEIQNPYAGGLHCGEVIKKFKG